MILGETFLGPLSLLRNRSLAAQRLELPASALYIPYTRHVDDTMLATGEGQFLQIMELAGFAHETEDNAEINQRHRVRNTLLRGLSASDIGFYFHTVRSCEAVLPEGEQPPGFARDLDTAWKDKLRSRRQYVNRLYITVCHKHGEAGVQRAKHLVTALSHKMDAAARAAWEQRARRRLKDVTDNVMSVLRAYQPRLLTVVDTPYGPHSEPLRFLGRLLNLEDRAYGLPGGAIARVLPTARPIFHGSGLIELRRPSGRVYAAILSIKEYNHWTAVTITEEFLGLRQEFILSQSFRSEERAITHAEIQRQQGRLRGTHDSGVTQTEELSDAMDEVHGDSGFGLHHFTVLAWAEDLETLNGQVAQCAAVLGNQGVLAIREDTNAEAAFYAQLPGNWRFIARGARISTKNLASFVTGHNYPHGRARGNHWGPSVTVLNTSTDTPYHFNFHGGGSERGNAAIIGMTGAGKTLLANFLFAQSLKFGGRRVILDKDRGTEIFVRALGGRYYRIVSGQPTGWNPLQLEDKPENREFLVKWYRGLLTAGGESLSTQDELLIDEVVAAGFDPVIPREARRLRHIAPRFGPPRGDNLAQRLRLWYGEGRLAYLFDNQDNILDLAGMMTGFDLTHILEDATARPAALLWILHNVRMMLDGAPMGIFADEGWRALDDPILAREFEDLEFTIRKKNGFFALSTQAPESILASRASHAIRQQTETFILLPNPRADREIYRDYLGLSEKQYTLLKRELSLDSRMFLVKNNTETVLCKLDLSGLDDMIAVLSGNIRTVALLDRIRAEAGDDPAVWLPIFHKRRKEIQ